MPEKVLGPRLSPSQIPAKPASSYRRGAQISRPIRFSRQPREIPPLWRNGSLHGKTRVRRIGVRHVPANRLPSTC